MRRLLLWLGALLLSLLLRIPFLVGMLAGFMGLCVVAFWDGYYRVYGEARRL